MNGTSEMKTSNMESGKTNLLGMTLEQLQTLCSTEGFPRFTAKQICDWLYRKRIDDISAMTNLSRVQRSRLEEIAYIGRYSPAHCQISADGTKKYLFNTADKAASTHVETVFIPDNDRATLCISCQRGCKMGCRFCVTGQQGFHGSLSAGEIINQILSIPEFDQLTNVVFMGMGEPMDNLDAVLDTTRILTSPWGLEWSPKRITVSTVGIIPGLQRFVEQSQCHLAVSLHNPVATERAEIMPVQRAYPIADVLALLRRYNWSGQRRLSFEYTMFHQLNDDLAHARMLVDALRGLPCRVNLIRFHSSPGTPYKTSSMQAIEKFQNYLNHNGVTCTLRASRGQDIDAACGLLAGKEHTS